MSKRLNSGLFEDFPNARSSEKVQAQGMALEPALGKAPLAPAAPFPLDVQKIMEELQLLKTKMRGYESHIDVFKNQMSDFVKTIDQRFERISQALSRMEKSIHNQGRDTEEKLRGMREKIQSQNYEEAKVEGLIERQTVVIRNFENRLAAMQKIINEKELLLMKYFEALKHIQQPQNQKK